MFVDASAICAIVLGEPDAPALILTLEQGPSRITSPVAMFEVVNALAREIDRDVEAMTALAYRFLADADIRLVDIGEAESREALAALRRFGKGRHPARLNMGDCFAYACARTHGVPLLYKGDDFPKTDIEAA